MTRPGQRVVIGMAIVLLAVLAVGRPAAAQSALPPRSPEYLIKAAYLYNFAMFVGWPADAFAAPDAPIVIGIVGSDPLGWAMDRTVQDKRINKRRIVVERLQAGQDLRHCHIVFITASEAAKAAEVVQRLEGAPVLVVGDTPEVVKRGTAINFMVEDNKVRFEVYSDAARRARLTVSSKLLSLAKAVR